MSPARTRPVWRRYLLPALLLLLGLNLAAFAAYTLPRTLALRSSTSRAEAARGEVERERARVEALQRQADAIRSNATDTERFYREVVGTERADLLAVLEDVERMASEPGLKPGRRNFQPHDVKGAPLSRVTIALPLTGSYQQLVAFLDRVERSPRFLTVDRVALSGGVDGSAQLQVELSAYFRSEGGKARAR